MHARPSHIRIVDRILNRLKLKQLRLLVAIAEKSSILHAAESLNISQPAATKLLQDLEADFGVQLFTRTNRGVLPTRYGGALEKHGKLILAQISHAAQELDDLNAGTGGRVVVGTLLAASAILLPRAIAHIRSERPGVSIAVREGTNDLLIPALRTGEVDLVVGRLPEYRHRKQLVQERLLDDKLLFVVRSGHPLAREEEVPIQRLASCDWILPPPETTLRRQIERALFDRELTIPANSVESVSFLSNRALLMSTDMIAIFPYHVAEVEIRSGTLKSLPVDPSLGSNSIGVTYRKDAELSPAALAFLAAIRASAQGLQSKAEQVEPGQGGKTAGARKDQTSRSSAKRAFS